MLTNTFSFRVNYYLLVGLFFLLPIVCFPIFGIEYLPFWYERYKVALLIMDTLLILIGLLSQKEVFNYWKKTVFWFTISIILLFAWQYIGWASLISLLLWTPEKRHGIVFFVSLIVLYFGMLKYRSQEWTKKIDNILLFSWMFVSIYALCQFIGLDFVPVQHAQMPWGIGRVFSTLGNPNYLAGFLLLLFPILADKKLKNVVGYWILFFIVLGLTGSVTGIVFGSGYIFYRLVKVYRPAVLSRKVMILLSLFLIVVVGGGIGYYSGSSKLLSLESRFSLWQSWVQVEKNNPLTILVGHGPDLILTNFSEGKIPLDPRYFAVGSQLDSFHNIILDFVFFFWIVGFLLVVYFLMRRWQKIPNPSRDATVLFFLFFSLNIPISVHFFMILYYLSLEKKEAKSS